MLNNKNTNGALSVTDAHNVLVTRIYELWAGAILAINRHYEDERGMSTIEYCLGCVAAAALGALLYTVVTSDTVENALKGIFEKALNTQAGG